METSGSSKPFHVSPKTGSGPCGATKGPCPYGDLYPHFETLAQADSFYLTNLEKEHEVLPSRRRDEAPKPSPALMGASKSPAPGPRPSHPRPGPPAPRPGSPAPRDATSGSSSPRPGPSHPRPLVGKTVAMGGAVVDPSRIKGRVPGPHYVYHSTLGFPKGLPKGLRSMKTSLTWTTHARSEASQDRYGAISMDSSFDAKAWDLVEVKLNKTDGKLNRLLYREKKPNAQGVVRCLVIAPDLRSSDHWAVITSWQNLANDEHKTLDKRRYDYPR